MLRIIRYVKAGSYNKCFIFSGSFVYDQYESIHMTPTASSRFQLLSDSLNIIINIKINDNVLSFYFNRLIIIVRNYIKKKKHFHKMLPIFI